MKKMGLVLVLTFILVLGFAMMVWADDDAKTKVYFDTWIGGNTNQRTEETGYDTSEYDFDTTCFFLGFDTVINRFKLGGDLGINGTIKADNGNFDFTMINLKFGYRILDGENSKVDIVAGFMNFDGKAYGNDACTGVMLGADLSYAFSDQMFFQGSYAFSMNGSWGDFDSADLSNLNLKVGCLVADNVALTAGYRLYTVKGKFSDSYYDYNYNLTNKMSGLTLGVMCGF